MQIQKSLFNLDEGIHYLNNAFMSPNLKSVEIAGIAGIKKKSKPYFIQAKHFFEPIEEVKKVFSELIDCDNHEKIALIPSASYGLSNVAKNMKPKRGQKIIIVSEQFPSNFYVWERLAIDYDLKIQIIHPENDLFSRAQNWNEKVYQAIDSETCLLACSHVHWADGTKFELEKFREACDRVGALLVIDGSQSIGVLPFSVKDIRPDAMITVGYKWLYGPYGSGYAYYSDALCDGVPIEENWINRKDSQDFKNLVNYESEYRRGANRFSVGQQSDFIKIPMLKTALDQIRAWGIQNMQAYSGQLIDPYIPKMKELGCYIEDSEYRSNHIIGIRLPGHIEIKALKEQLQKHNIYVSLRGSAVRLSTSVYNSRLDLDAFIRVLENQLVS